MNVGVLFAAILGASGGYWFFVQYRQALVSLAYDLRMIADPAYREACLDLLENPNFHKTAKPEFNVLTRSEHYDAIKQTRNKIDKTLKTYNKVIASDLVKRAILFGVLPVVLLAFMGVAPYFLAAAFVVLSAAIIHEIAFLNRPGFALHMRLSSLLAHAYADAGFRARSTVTNSAAPAVKEPKPLQTAPDSPPPFDQIAQQAVVVRPSAAEVHAPQRMTQTPSTTRFDDDDDDDIEIPTPPQVSEPRKISFSTVWWGLDALICFGVVLNFWISDANNIWEILLMPFVLAAIIQVFFVPMYFIIHVAQKMLRTSQNQTTL